MKKFAAFVGGAAALVLVSSAAAAINTSVFYYGTLSATVYDSNTPAGQKTKMPFMMFVNTDNSTSVYFTDGPSLYGGGQFGTYHGVGRVIGSGGVSVYNLHFGKDFKTAKGNMQVGFSGGDVTTGQIIEGKFNAKLAGSLGSF